MAAAVEPTTQPFLRPRSLDDEPDHAWLFPLLESIAPYSFFVLLRPTAPGLTAQTIQAALASLQAHEWADSLRLITPWKGPHPGKMWRSQGKRIDGMMPVMEGLTAKGAPYHSSPTQSLPPVFRQTAGLEIGRELRCVRAGSLAGDRVMPFLVYGTHAIDLNVEADWAPAEAAIFAAETARRATLDTHAICCQP